jgi:ribose/xylose/arabinose/galactoside ABC-type transport system permease subunit
MIRVLSLLWTLALSLVVTGISFFYIRGAARGFPFSFSQEVAGQGSSNLQFNSLSLIFDIVFWWLLFSVLWIILKNYIFES